MKTETENKWIDIGDIVTMIIFIFVSGLIKNYFAAVAWIVAFAWFMQYRSTRDELETIKQIKIETALEDYATKNNKKSTGK